jgi:hypothetical protein
MIAKVRLWGRTIGAGLLDDERDVAAFQYDADFARSGIELSRNWKTPRASHQMTLNGKRDGFTLQDFESCAKAAVMKRGRAATIIEEVRAAVKRWPEFAAEANLADEWRDDIQNTHRLSFPEK